MSPPPSHLWGSLELLWLHLTSCFCFISLRFLWVFWSCVRLRSPRWTFCMSLYQSLINSRVYKSSFVYVRQFFTFRYTNCNWYDTHYMIFFSDLYIVQGLLFTLHSGIPLGKLGEQYRVTGDQTQVSCMQSKHHNSVLSLWTPIEFFFWFVVRHTKHWSIH